MAVSSGSLGFFRVTAVWCLFACGAGVGVTRFDEIRSLLGLKLDARDLGLESEAQPLPETPRGHAGPPRSASTPRGHRTVVLQAGNHGHFEAEANVNGRRIAVMVDTGASTVALTFEDAEAAGIFPRDSDFKLKVNTANGVARVAPVTLDSVTIDDITVRNVRAVVAEPGRLNQTLLGMSFLGQLSRAEMSRGTLTLQE